MQRLRESSVWSLSDGGSLLNESQIKNLNINSTRLKESKDTSLEEIILTANNLKSQLQENDANFLDSIINRLKETGIKNTFKIWKLPVGKYGNLNGNKRIYTKELWENVRDKQRDTWCGNSGLCDHPVADNDPGEFKNQGCIWHDMEVGNNNTVYGFVSFVGPYGHLAQEILEHGGKVGTSSSGFGDVDPITKVVDPSTYIIERLADLVLNPSQGTYGVGTECPHTAGEFMDNVNGGATIEFNKQNVREAQSAIVNNKIRRQEKMAGNNMAFNAAQQQQSQGNVQQPAAPSGGATQQPQAAATGTQPQQQVQENTMSKGTLAKVEEKAFRKYVQGFLDDANKIDNPMKRLNECVDILSCFEEGNCPDLKESLERQLLEEKDKLEQLIENVVKTENDYEMDIKSFRESAERNTAQGMLLKEQVTDYKELCEGLSRRNIQLKEELEKAHKMLKIKERLAEKKIVQSNKQIVSTSNVSETLREENEKLKERNEKLIDRVSKLALNNKTYITENETLAAKIKEAGSIMQEVKVNNKLTEDKQSSDKVTINRLQKKLTEADSVIKDLERNYDAQSKRYDKLLEDFKTYKQEVNDTYNPVAHLMPKMEERVGKYLNLRENKGIEIEAYWADQLEKYGEALLPFEDKIRGAKTLKEATNNFLKYRTQIDPNFQVAQPAEYAYRNREERAQLYEQAGIINPVQSYMDSSADEKNESFLKNLKEQGLQ